MRLKTWHFLSLLVLAVLVAYSPSLTAGYNSVDDIEMISRVDQAGPLDLGRLFLPHGTSYYYRPLTILSYTLDRDVWGSIPSFMHLENILLHLISVFLVFTITRRLLPLWGEKSQIPAFFAGLFFALHPIATESVCWISGRTDPLMGLFILLAVWLLLMALELGSFTAAFVAGVALCLAGLAKEIAVFTLPGLLWLIVVYPGQDGWGARLRQRCWVLLMPVFGVAGYFILRHLATARDSGVQKALKGAVEGDYDLLNKMRIAFKVYGFYFKKLFVPWPLNFGIIEISGWYVLAGIMLAGLLLFLAWRADVAGAFGLLAFCALSPALLVVVGKMTWTPLAERYLYSSVALFAPLAAYLFIRLRSYITRSMQLSCNLATVLLLLVFFGSTLHRSWIWQDNLRLYSDTVKKSPNFLPAKSELASALMRKGRLAEAEAILVGMQGGEGASEYINDDLNLAAILMSQGDLAGARNTLLQLIKSKHNNHYEVLQAVLKVNDRLIGRAETPELKSSLQKESLAWMEEQQRLRPSPFTLYRIGKMQLAMGDETSALASFQASLAKTPADAYYRGAIETFIKKLEGS